jgi:hypothetical protein
MKINNKNTILYTTVTGFPWEVSFYFFTKENTMPQTQIQKLMQDSAELENFAQKLQIEGKLDLVKKVKAKKKYLDDYITGKSHVIKEKVA